MNAVLLYQPRRRCLIWIAFACAAGIHAGAIVIAQGKSEKVATQDFEPAAVDIEVIDQDRQQPPEQVAIPPPAEQVPADQEAFPQENATPPPIRPRKKTSVAASGRSAARGTVVRFGLVKALVMYAPRPVYPYEARRQRITGSGVALLTVAWEDGSVVDVRMAQSSGSVILDNATLEAFRRWRFKAGTVARVQVPVTYTLTGASY